MTHIIRLRTVEPADLDHFFEHQLDPDAVQMAAFTAKDPTNRAAFDAHWAKILADDGVTIRTILLDDVVAGYVLVHGWFGEPEVSYWVGRPFWGKGVATEALRHFLRVVEERPLYARIVHDNVGSLRVLQKCGFVQIGSDRGFANARGAEVDELVLRLESAD